VLVFDVADDFLDQIFDRDEPVGAAIFVDHERQMNAGRLHFHEQVDRGHRRRHVKNAPYDLRVR
jgi:hypothetical protein